MTIAISLKVNDGVVLATDSASTLMAENPQGQAYVVNVYNSANKIFNLRKGLPVGAVTWGAGSIGTESISTLAKDLRRRFTIPVSSFEDWQLNPDTYTMLGVAERLRQFMFDDLYVPKISGWKQPPELGFIVAGYSAKQNLAEEYAVIIAAGGTCGPPELLRPLGESGSSWGGQPEALNRLVMGFGTGLASFLQNHLKVTAADIPAAVAAAQAALGVPLVMPAMPIQDAIDLAAFFVDVTCQFSRFSPGAQTVGGPIEIAAITKHEGFRWVTRKHYYSAEFNPPMTEDGL
jgi:hypothetical protein